MMPGPTQGPAMSAVGRDDSCWSPEGTGSCCLSWSHGYRVIRCLRAYIDIPLPMGPDLTRR